METSLEKERLWKGARLLMVGALGFSLASSLSKGLASHLSPFQIFAYQHLIALLLFLPWAFLTCRKERFWKITNYPLHLFRAVTGAGYFILLYLALQSMDLVNATTVANATPLFVPLVAKAWLKERLPIRLFFGIGVALFGVVMLLRPSSAIFDIAAIIALTAALFSATAIVSIRVLTAENSVLSILFYYLTHTGIFAVGYLIFTQSPLPKSSELISLSAMAVGLCLGQLGLSLSGKVISPARVAPFNYFGVLFVSLFSFIFYGTLPLGLSLLPILCIIAGGLIALGATKSKSSAKP